MRDPYICHCGKYALRYVQSKGLIESLGVELENCLSKYVGFYFMFGAFRQVGVFALYDASKPLVALTVCRAEEQLYISDMRAKHNQRINGTEPFYPALQTAIAVLERLYGSAIGPVDYVTRHSQSYNDYLHLESVANNWATLKRSCDDAQPGVFEFVWGEVCRGKAHRLMKALMMGRQFTDLWDDDRVRIAFDLLPFIAPPRMEKLPRIQFVESKPG